MLENVDVASMTTSWAYGVGARGRTVAQNRSKRKVSNTSRTMSMLRRLPKRNGTTVWAPGAQDSLKTKPIERASG